MVIVFAECSVAYVMGVVPQMSFYVLVAGEQSGASASQFLLSLLRGHVSGQTPGVCVLSKLTSTSKVLLEAGLQLCVGVAMVALLVVVSLVGQCPLRKSRLRRESTHDLPIEDSESLPLHKKTGAQGGVYQSLSAHDDDAVPMFRPEDRVQVDTATELSVESFGSRLVTAAVNFGLSAYAAVSAASMRLLHCVHVPGSPPAERRLFIRGSVTCDYTGWQFPLVLILAVLVATPIVLPMAAAWSVKKAGPRGSKFCGRSGRIGVRRALVDMYVDRHFWWEAVMMAQRLVSGTSVVRCS